MNSPEDYISELPNVCLFWDTRERAVGVEFQPGRILCQAGLRKSQCCGIVGGYNVLAKIELERTAFFDLAEEKLGWGILPFRDDLDLQDDLSGVGLFPVFALYR
ncbi:MAG: hypothetical protein R3B54_16905 [Bdellovibrionota bacterium]